MYTKFIIMSMKGFKFLRGNPYDEVGGDLTIDPSMASYWDVLPEFICVGVTPRRTDPDTYEPYRHLVFEHVQSGRMTQANIVNTEHPMYNFYREIEPDFYNSHYVDREPTVSRYDDYDEVVFDRLRHIENPIAQIHNFEMDGESKAIIIRDITHDGNFPLRRMVNIEYEIYHINPREPNRMDTRRITMSDDEYNELRRC